MVTAYRFNGKKPIGNVFGSASLNYTGSKPKCGINTYLAINLSGSLTKPFEPIGPQHSIEHRDYLWKGACREKESSIGKSGFNIDLECPVTCKDGDCEPIVFQSVAFSVLNHPDPTIGKMPDTKPLQMVAIEVIARFKSTACCLKKCDISVRVCQVRWGNLFGGPAELPYYGPPGLEGPYKKSTPNSIHSSQVPSILRYGCKSYKISDWSPTDPST